MPSLPRSSQPFWGQNPLKVPLLCGFRRIGGRDVTPEDLAYVTPCGLCLCSHDDVMQFLFATDSYDVLQVRAGVTVATRTVILAASTGRPGSSKTSDCVYTRCYY